MIISLKNSLLFLGLSILSLGTTPASLKVNPRYAQITLKVTTTLMDQPHYIRLEGFLGTSKVIFHLQLIQGKVRGNYFCDGHWVNLDGESKKDGNIILLGSVLEQEDSQYSIKLNHKFGVFRGECIDEQTGKISTMVLREKYPPGSVRLNSGHTIDSLILPKGVSHYQKPRFSQHYLFSDTTKNNWLEETLKQQHSLSPEMQWVSEFNKRAKKKLAYIASELKTLIKEKAIDLSGQYGYESREEVILNGNDLLVYQRRISESLGGEDLKSTQLICIDMATQRRLQLKDVLVDTARVLDRALEASFRKQRKITTEPMSEYLGVTKIHHNNNFAISPYGLTFFYNPYELAGPSEGIVSISVNIDDFPSLFKNEIILRLKNSG